MKTITSRDDCTIKLTPNKVTRKNVPRHISLTTKKKQFFKTKIILWWFSTHCWRSHLLTSNFTLHPSQHCILASTLLLMQIKKLTSVISIKPNFNYYEDDIYNFGGKHLQFWRQTFRILEASKTSLRYI